MGEMLESLVKKDEDAKVASYDPHSGSMQVETIVNLSEQDFCHVQPMDDFNSPIDTSLLRDDSLGPSSDVPVRIMFTVFSVTAAYHFATLTGGILFYLVLLYDETRQVSIVVCSITGTLCAVFYCLSAWQRKSFLGNIFFGLLAFVRILFIAALSQLIGNELLYLLELVYIFQSAVVVIYTTKWPRNDSMREEKETKEERIPAIFSRLWANAYRSRYAKVALMWLLGVSTLVYTVGLIFFVSVFFKEFIWLWGVIFYIVLFSACLYKWRYIGDMFAVNGGRYSVSTYHRKLAIIEYYTDPIVSAWNKVLAI